jgi:hypothetical protein
VPSRKVFRGELVFVGWLSKAGEILRVLRGLTIRRRMALLLWHFALCLLLDPLQSGIRASEQAKAFHGVYCRPSIKFSSNNLLFCIVCTVMQKICRKPSMHEYSPSCHLLCSVCPPRKMSTHLDEIQQGSTAVNRNTSAAALNPLDKTPPADHSLLRKSCLSSCRNKTFEFGSGSNVIEFIGFSSLARWNMSSYTLPSYRPRLLSSSQSGNFHASTNRTACGRISSSSVITAFVLASVICLIVVAWEEKNSDASCSSVFRAKRR